MLLRGEAVRLVQELLQITDEENFSDETDQTLNQVPSLRIGARRRCRLYRLSTEVWRWPLADGFNMDDPAVAVSVADLSWSVIVFDRNHRRRRGDAPLPSGEVKARRSPPPGAASTAAMSSATKGMTMMGKLQGKLAVVTGGTTGIGFATAKRFVDEGAYVFITGRRQKELDEAVKTIGRGVAAVQGDVAKLQDLDRLYETVKAKGKIDVLVANAGIGEFASLASLTEAHFDKLFDLNVKGTLFTVQKALPLMNDGGSIILIGSVASVKGTASFGTYGATKAAVRNLVRTWTMELKDRRIRSNVLSPGPIRTPLTDIQPPDIIARIVGSIPMGRMGEPDEVAKAAVFLASDDSSFVTGIELFVDGGRGQV
jgi:NAD(P)-dependent dehydrogenase (short-subunit alcohol dehydrogenase family)